MKHPAKSPALLFRYFPALTCLLLFFLPAKSQYTWYQDLDGDGWGLSSVSQTSSTKPTGFVLNNLDCNDNQVNASSWSYLGTAGFSSGTANHTTVAADNNGLVYVAYADASAGKATVKKFDGTSWSTVGTAGFSSGQVSDISLLIDNNNVPYIGYCDFFEGQRVTVKKFNGSSWVTVGTAGFTSGTALYLSMALSPTNQPYVLYQDGDVNSKATVMTYNGTSWVIVGSSGFSSGLIGDNSIVIDNSGTPYVSYYNAENFLVEVKYFNGTSWMSIGSGIQGSGPVMTFDNSGVPYMAIDDYLGNNRAAVYKFNGSSWEQVGNGGLSTGFANYKTLAFNKEGSAFFSYSDDGQSNKAVVRKFNGTTWSAVGGASVSTTGGNYSALAFDAMAVPLLVYKDASTGNKASVKKLGPQNSAPTTPVLSANTTTICNSGSSTLSLTGSLNGASSWKWYASACSGTSIGTGTSITVSPVVTTTYFARGEGGCVTSPGVCGSITINVASALNPSLSISNNSGTTICAGTNVTFTASASGAGSTTSYQWKKNGNNVGTNSTSYSDNGLANNDVVSCVLTVPCTAPVTSNSIAMTVQSLVIPSVSISSAQGATICKGTSVSFSAAAVNGGSSPLFQWKKNSTNVGSGSNSYTDANLNNGDVISCVLTSNSIGPCLSSPTATSNTVTMTVNSVTNAANTTLSATPSAICAGNSVTLSASAGGGPSICGPQSGFSSPYAPANWTLAQTNSNGSVDVSGAPATIVLNGTDNSSGSQGRVEYSVLAACAGTISFQWSYSTVEDPAYDYPRYRVNSGVTQTIPGYSTTGAQEQSGTFSINLNAGDRLRIQAHSVDNSYGPCTITLSNFVAPAFTQNNTLPQIAWYTSSTGGIAIGSGPSLSQTLTDAGTFTYYAELSDAANGCVHPARISKSVTVDPVLPAGLLVTASDTSICAGTSVVFNAAPSGSAPDLVYQWQKNGTPVGTNDPSYSDNNLSDGDIISCLLTSSNSSPCLSGSRQGNALTVHVGSGDAPSVVISAATGTTICQGSTVVLSSLVQGAGSDPLYQWKLNGDDIPGATQDSYATSSLNDNDQISLEVTGNNTCGSSGSTGSDTLLFSVVLPHTPSVTISASDTAICEGASVSLTSFPVDAGPSPSYQWQLNGSDIPGADQSSYSTSSLEEGDAITLVVTPVGACSSQPFALSNEIAFSVAESHNPLVSISTASTAICSGSTVDAVSNVTDAGPGALYQWQLNGTDIPGATASGYTTASLSDNDVLSLQITSSGTCTSQPVTSSNGLQFIVKAISNPLVSISATASEVCAGTEVVFTALVSDAGSDPAYRWELNGNGLTEETSATYSSTTLADGDAVRCFVTSSDACASTPEAGSNTLATIVHALPAVDAGSYAPVCFGLNPVSLSGTPSGGTFGGSGISGSSFIPSAGSGSYALSYTYTDAFGCSNTDTATILVNNCNPCSVPPEKPWVINQVSGAAKICPGEQRSFSIAAVVHAVFYDWTVPAGCTIVSGQGTTAVTLGFDGAFTGGSLAVTARNNCGTSIPATRPLVKGPVPAAPSTITGKALAVCGLSGEPYSVKSMAGLVYAWSLSDPAVAISSGQGTNAIVADFSAGTSASVIMQVTAANTCGVSAPRKLTVKSVPANAGAISGLSVVCPNTINVVYSIDPVENAASYTWSIPAGTISDGVTTTSKTLTTTSNTVSLSFTNKAGALTVKPNNLCGTGVAAKLTISLSCGGSREAEPGAAGEVTIFPNPAREKIKVSFTAPAEGRGQYYIVDAVGKKLQSGELVFTEGENLLEVPLSGYAAGLYQLVLMSAPAQEETIHYIQRFAVE